MRFYSLDVTYSDTIGLAAPFFGTFFLAGDGENE